MIEKAESYGFVRDHIGCPCNGSPQVMILRRDGKIYTLTVWTRRDVWKLASQGYTYGFGNSSNLETKLHEYGIL